MHELKISPVTLEDLDAVRALATSIWHLHYPGIITPAQIDYMLAQRYSREVLREELQTPGIWWEQVHRLGERVGFCATQRSAHPGELKLDKLYVHPDAQRHGIGRALIEHAVARARSEGCTALILAVNKHNAQAIAAYEKHGFVRRAAIQTDIGGGFIMDDFIMARPLV